MVRRIRSCRHCNDRFVAFAGASCCSKCSIHIASKTPPTESVSLKGMPIQEFDNVEQNKVSECLISHQGEPCEDNPCMLEEDNFSEAAGSEGGDDILCTQLRDDDQAGQDNEDNNIEDCGEIESINVNDTLGVEETLLIAEESSRQRVPIDTKSEEENTKPSLSNDVARGKTSNPTTANTPTSHSDVCFICGTSLAKLKNRLGHIKRCAKKHGIAARDVKVNTDMEAFQAANEDQVGDGSISTKIGTNPYTSKTSSWHGDANLALRLAAEGNTEASTILATGSSNDATRKQTSLDSFLDNPVRNLNNVLIAGARRMTKTAELRALKEISNKDGTTAMVVKKSGFRGRKRGRGSWSKVGTSSYASRRCPMYKKIPGTDFVCDGFYFAKSSLTKNYFLTHFHSDHYGGITKSWNLGVIYCSLPTAALVSQQLGVDKKYLHPIPMNTPTIVPSQDKPITVTLLPANHCPGAVMFLFEVGKRCILHVGDFRWNREVMMQSPQLRDFATEQKILDDLFLDTTYCYPKYTLPSQHEAISAVQEIFEKELALCKDRNSKTLHLFGAYTIGKERMYLSVAEKFGLKVYVDSARYRILSALDWPKVRLKLLTKNKEESSIWVVPLGHINMKKLPEYFAEANNKPFVKAYDRIVGYRPTGWSMGSKPSSSVVSSRKSGNLVIHGVPYSEHSSFPELVDCLACLKPQRIVPTVNTGKSDEQVQTLLKGLREKQSTLPFLKNNAK